MAKMTLKRAKQLYKKAHIGLTPSEEEAAHKAEKLLKKKGIEAERNGKKFSFSHKKGEVKEAKDFYPGSGEVHPVTGEIIHEPVPVSRKDKLMRMLRSLLKQKKKQKPSSNERLPF
jgi:hypothetical protein